MAAWTSAARNGVLALAAAASVAACGGGGGHHHDDTATPTPTSTAGTPTSAPTPQCATAVVETTSGPVCGLVVDVVDAPDLQVDAFYGIPYGETTEGTNRWKAPIAKARSTTTIQATNTTPPACPQTDDGPFSAGRSTSEDCLSVNVWRPETTAADAGLPIMVWVYGGSFTSGGTNVPAYDGGYLAATQTVIVVTLNYRVGALGFLAGVDGLTGNYGLQDQQLALEWVRDNAAAFGGDPAKVTIFGESAGAMSVGLHALSIPSSDGLFRSIVMQSNPLGIPYKTLAEATDAGELFKVLVGCEGQDLACLQAVPAAEIVEQQSSEEIAALSFLGNRLGGFLVFAPLIDGTFLTVDPTISAGQGGLSVPTVFGTNAAEGTIFVAAIAELEGGTISAEKYVAVLTFLFGVDDAADIVARYGIGTDNVERLSDIATDYLFACANRYVARQAQGPIWGYEFTETGVNVWPDVPACDDEACHGDDVPFTFHADQQLGFTFTPGEATLSDEMVGYWASFATRLDPNDGGVFAWPSFTSAGLEYLELDAPALSTVTDPAENCDLWDEIGYDVGASITAMNAAIEAARR